jgi:predicted Ser/Thr protein kinase
MKTKPLVVLCWIQVIAAAAVLLLNLVNLITRPATGFEYSRRTWSVTSVLSGGPADRAGIAIGDRIISVNGNVIGPDVYTIYFARAGQPLPVVFDRAGVRHTVQLVPITIEQLRRGHLRAGGTRAMSAISGYLSFPLHFWMFGLAIALLVLRPDNKDARLAALCLIYWVGSTFLFRGFGMGVLLDALPRPLPLVLMIADAYFAAGFFAACMHFALVFPTERRGAWEWVPYLVASPILIETLANNLARLRGDVRPVPLPFDDAYSTIGTLMLIATLTILIIRFTRIDDVNVRRRLQLIFLSILPGAASFISAYAVSLLQLGASWDTAIKMLHTPATMIGSGIFTYAVLRHRIFNIRVLVRRSLQYAFARSTLVALMMLPVIALAAFLYVNRGESLSTLLTGTPMMYVLLILPLVLVIRYRRRLLEWLDRRFFREQYDARHLLLHVVSIIRGGSDSLVLSRAALDEIDRALHPKHLSLWQLDPDAQALHRGFARGGDDPINVEPLTANGTLATLLSTDDDPLDVQSRQTRTLLQRLPEIERDWLRRADAHLIVPLLIDERLVGLMVLGERKSEEPYSREDRELLRMLGAQLALTLDYSRLKHSPSLVWSPLSTPAPIHLHLSDALQLCPRCGRCYASDETRCDTDSEMLVPESGVPRTIEDKYIVTRLLGRGGMGSVYLATQKRLNRPVAIKVLLSHLVGSSSMRSRFEREARIVARLRHPAIVTIHDFGVLPSGHAYLVMEYLDGDTLRKTIVSGPQPLAPALDVLRQVGDAVDAAHRVGVVHRDLKPENIMIVREHHSALTPRVLDFGLAKMSGPIGDDEQTVVQSGHSAGVVGTLMYMAPEVLSGHVADARSDQYSLGIIAWELLAGEHPLGLATDLASVVRGHTDRPMIPIRDRVSGVPRHVSDAIDRALAKQADARFATVGEFVAAMTA